MSAAPREGDQCAEWRAWWLRFWVSEFSAHPQRQIETLAGLRASTYVAAGFSLAGHALVAACGLWSATPARGVYLAGAVAVLFAVACAHWPAGPETSIAAKWAEEEVWLEGEEPPEPPELMVRSGPWWLANPELFTEADDAKHYIQRAREQIAKSAKGLRRRCIAVRCAFGALAVQAAPLLFWMISYPEG